MIPACAWTKRFLAVSGSLIVVCFTVASRSTSSCKFSNKRGPCGGGTLGCEREVWNTRGRGLLHCARACCPEPTCVGVSTGEHDLCYLHRQCESSAVCASYDDTLVKFYAKLSSSDEGTSCTCPVGKMRAPDSNSNVCQCVEDTSSADENLFDCLTLYPQHSTEGYVKASSEPNDNKVMCENDGNGVKTFIYRNNGRFNIYYWKWSDYVNGFQFDLDNFWMGLKYIHDFTAAGYTDIHFDVSIIFDLGLAVFQRSYSDFFVDKDSTQYVMRVGKSRIRNFGKMTYTFNTRTQVVDCLTPNNNSAFSTPDKNMDADQCGNTNRPSTGWWFKDCNFFCNPLGPIWSEWHGLLEEDVSTAVQDVVYSYSWLSAPISTTIEMYFYQTS